MRARSVTYGLSLSSRSSLVSMPLNRRANIVLSCMIRVNPTVSPGTATCTHARTSTESIDRNSSRFLFKKKCGNSQKTSSSNKHHRSSEYSNTHHHQRPPRANRGPSSRNSGAPSKPPVRRKQAQLLPEPKGTSATAPRATVIRSGPLCHSGTT